MESMSFSGDIPYYFIPYFCSALQDAEYRDLPGSSPATVSFSSAAKVGFIHLNLSWENKWCILIRTGYWLTKQVEEIIYSVVWEIELTSGFSHRCIQFEELDCKEYPCQGYSQSLKNTPSSETPFLPTIITFELAASDSTYPRTLTVRASIIFPDYSLLSKIILGSLIVGRVMPQFYEIHSFDHPSIYWWSLLSNHQKNNFLSAVPRRGPKAGVLRIKQDFHGSGVNRIDSCPFLHHIRC